MDYGVLGFKNTDLHGRTTSGFLSKISKKFKKFVGEIADFKELWVAGRGFLDSFAGAAGVPLQQLRQEFRNQGKDPDSLESIMELWAEQNGGAGAFPEDPEKATALMELAEKDAASVPATGKMILIGGALLLLLGGGLLRGGGGGRFRKAGRAFKRFSRSFKSVGRLFRGRRRRR